MTNDFPTRVGGIETFSLALARGLAPDVVVYTASMPGDLAYDRGLPFPVYRDPARILLPTPSVARRVAEVMARHGCDRVVFGASVPLGLLAPGLRRAGARRIVALTHGHEVWWARLAADPSRAATGGRLRRPPDLRQRVVPAPDRAGPLPGRAGAGWRASPRASTRPRSTPVAGVSGSGRSWASTPRSRWSSCLARLVRRKGQDTLIRSWREVLREHPDAVLLLVGTGPDGQRLRRLAHREGVAGSVVLAGLADAADVPAFLDAGDVFAMPCRTRRAGLEVEAWGIVFVEAQACGLPTVVGDSGGAPETVVDPTYDVVVGGAPWQVAATVNQLLKRRHEGRRRPESPFTWAAACRRVEQLLDGAGAG